MANGGAKPTMSSSRSGAVRRVLAVHRIDVSNEHGTTKMRIVC